MKNPHIWLQISLVGAWLGIILILAETLNRFAKVNPEVSRKVVHVGTGNVILLAWWLKIPAWIGITAGIISGAIALISYKLPILPSVNSVGRKSLGTFFYAVSIGILIGWFWSIEQPEYAALGILIMSWGDGLAAVIGQNFGKHPYQVWGINKSWEGSLTMCLVSYIICCLILLVVQGNIWQTWVLAIPVALAATGLETLSKIGIDNLTVPLGSAALCFLLNQFF
ncbi:SEC59/DGK1/VTE5 family protein [Okeania sp.]|uniref:diacylglycerol/polyprenol kinase family protein n=1 Tax=Okeania sp. TaxID=3100323 RepID=UPI002B4B35C6|nr:SEC59/DGK1/VTE5 family protein [Okeania sp.]MEB3342971.1 SEC59/DGK1/VTE5 family protein [Okeania sp.]